MTNTHLNKYGWYFLIFLLCGFISPEPNSKKDVIHGNYRIQISEQSHLVINGQTNINSFSCGYDGNFYQDTLSVSAIINGDHLHFKNAQLILKTALFNCENKLMNPDFQNLLQAEKYPNIFIRVLEINKNRKDVQKLLVSNHPENSIVILSVEITLAGQKNNYDLPIEVNHEEENRLYSGHLELNIRDFGLTPPKKMLGLVVVNEMVQIDFKVAISLL